MNSAWMLIAFEFSFSFYERLVTNYDVSVESELYSTDAHSKSPSKCFISPDLRSVQRDWPRRPGMWLIHPEGSAVPTKVDGGSLPPEKALPGFYHAG